jgi:spermidine/putrescine-binding protein
MRLSVVICVDLNLVRFISRFLIIAALALIGCRRIDNARHEILGEKRSLVIFNREIAQQNLIMGGAELDHAEVSKQFKGNTLRVLAWEECLPASALDAFRERYGARIVVEPFATDAEALKRLRGSSEYDLALISSHFAEELFHDHELSEFNGGQLANWKCIDKEFRSLFPADRTPYFVPYMWSLLGIAYNSSKLDFIPQSWSQLYSYDPQAVPALRERVGLLPNFRFNFSMSLLSLGHSPNSEDPLELREAQQFLKSRMDKLKVAESPRDMMNLLSDGRVLMAQAFVSDVARLNLSRIQFSAPREGTCMRVDVFVIPKAGPPLRKALAHEFVNYMLQPEIAAAAVVSSFRCSTVGEVRAILPPKMKAAQSYLTRSRGEFPYLLSVSEQGFTFQQDSWDEMQVR